MRKIFLYILKAGGYYDLDQEEIPKYQFENTGWELRLRQVYPKEELERGFEHVECLADAILALREATAAGDEDTVLVVESYIKTLYFDIEDAELRGLIFAGVSDVPLTFLHN